VEDPPSPIKKARRLSGPRASIFLSVSLGSSGSHPNSRTVAAGTIAVLVQQHTQGQQVRGFTRPLLLLSPWAPRQSPAIRPARASANESRWRGRTYLHEDAHSVGRDP